MICLLLIMTVIFINSTESVEPKVRHPDTLLQEEDMTAKTKIWLLMVESGKVDEEEIRRITPKSIFIAPLLTSRTEKCKEGYRLNHLGQCVKVIKIDPKVQLELLLQRLNKLYGEKNEEKEEQNKEEKEEEKEEQNGEEKKEETEVSNGPLHFSLPISLFNGKTGKERNETKLENSKENLSPTENFNDGKTTPELIPIPLPMIYQNHTTEIKDIESSGAEPLNVTELIETSEFEGSGDELTASGDGSLEGKSTTSPPINILSEETDYLDISETESTTFENSQYTETPPPSPTEELSSTKSDTLEDVSLSDSYQNSTDTPSVNDISEDLPKENTQVQKEITVKNNSKSDKIIFPSDDNGRNEELRTPTKSSPENSRIRFPDEDSQLPTPSHHSFPNLNSKPNWYHIHPSAISREQFWWLPKNWQIDENQQKSPLLKVWSRLPLFHDVSYSRETPESFKKSGYLEESQMFNSRHKKEEFTISSDRQQPPTRYVKPFRSSRFQDVIPTPRQHFRLQR